MFVSLQFQDVRDKDTAESLISKAVPDLRTLFHFKRDQGFRFSASMDYKGYERLLVLVSAVNAQLPEHIEPFEVVARQGDLVPQHRTGFHY